jgi:hypothetical protein
MRRWHLDVHDRDVGLVRSDLEQQILGGAALPDDLESGLVEQAGDAFAQEHRVVGEDDADWRRSFVLLIGVLDVDAASVADNRAGAKQRWVVLPRRAAWFPEPLASPR